MNSVLLAILLVLLASCCTFGKKQKDPKVPVFGSTRHGQCKRVYKHKEFQRTAIKFCLMEQKLSNYDVKTCLEGWVSKYKRRCKYCPSVSGCKHLKHELRDYKERVQVHVERPSEQIRGGSKVEYCQTQHGKQEYDAINQICCNMTIYEPQDDHQMCCQDTMLDRHRFKCCNDTARQYSKRKRNEMKCCGSDTYDITAQVCCSGQVLDNARFKCCNGLKHEYNNTDRNHISCCGSDTYDMNVQVCCSGQVLDNTDRNHISCCGSDTYDITVQVCCSGQVLDNARFKCCNGLKHEYNNTDRNHISCCDIYTYDERVSICCEDHILDKRLYKCCNGTPVRFQMADSENIQCCGSKVYDSHVHSCYANMLLDRGNHINHGSDSTAIYLKNLPKGANYKETDIDSRMSDSSNSALISVILVSVLIPTVFVSTVLMVLILRCICSHKRSAAYKTTASKMDLETETETISPCISTITHNNGRSNNRHEITFESDIRTHFVEEASVMRECPWDACVNPTQSNTSLSRELNITMPSVPTFKSTENNVATKINSFSLTSSSIQTEEPKPINIKDVMGRDFICRHNFDANNKTLQLPNSSVKLTLSEEDVSDGYIECHATTFRNVFQVNTFLQHIMPDMGCLASAMVEYCFPQVETLTNFASVYMEHIGIGKHIHVWKIETGYKEIHVPVEVHKKDNVDILNPDLDAYYEEIRPGVIKIFLKTFCCLVCTACADIKGYTFHENFQIDAYVYTTEEADLLRVTLYLADPIYHVEDYKQQMRIHHGERNAKLERRFLKLPSCVSLVEDMLHVELQDLNNERNWICSGGTSEQEDIPISQITGCHKTKSSGLPYSKDWLIAVLADINGGVPQYAKFLIESRITLNYDGFVHPPPKPTKLVVMHEIESASIRRAAIAKREEHVNVLYDRSLPSQVSPINRGSSFGEGVRNELSSTLPTGASGGHRLEVPQNSNVVHQELSTSPVCSHGQS